MKKDFLEPEIEILVFSIEDVITTSGDDDWIPGTGDTGTGGGIKW